MSGAVGTSYLRRFNKNPLTHRDLHAFACHLTLGRSSLLYNCMYAYRFSLARSLFR